MCKSCRSDIVELVGCGIWECRSAYPRRKQARPGKPWDTGVSGVWTGRRIGQKIGFDHRDDHRQQNEKIQ